MSPEGVPITILSTPLKHYIEKIMVLGILYLTALVAKTLITFTHFISGKYQILRVPSVEANKYKIKFLEKIHTRQ